MMFPNLKLLYKNNKRETIYSITRLTNLSTKVKMIYYETVNHSYGSGVCIDVNDLLCWELNFKGE